MREWIDAIQPLVIAWARAGARVGMSLLFVAVVVIMGTSVPPAPPPFQNLTFLPTEPAFIISHCMRVHTHIVEISPSPSPSPTYTTHFPLSTTPGYFILYKLVLSRFAIFRELVLGADADASIAADEAKRRNKRK